MPDPVSRKDFRLESTSGQPLLIPLAIPLPASSSSWVTVSLTIPSYASISKVTRLWLAGSSAFEAAAQLMTRRVGREKLHFINPVPLHEVYERWVRKFERQRLGLLHDLKKELEGE